MIGKLTGILDKIYEGYIIIDVNGVGYIVFCSKSSIAKFGGEKSNISILIETHVREDQITLFGFATEEEKIWYNLLTKVNGVGPKMGLNILSVLTPASLQVAITAKDKAAFKSVSGVGPKLAERIITELKDKSLDVSMAAAGAVGVSSSAIVNAGQSNVEGNDSQNITDTQQRLFDATSALENLGFNKSEAFSVVNRILQKEPNTNVEALITMGLKELSRV